MVTAPTFKLASSAAAVTASRRALLVSTFSGVNFCRDHRLKAVVGCRRGVALLAKGMEPFMAVVL